MFLDQSIIFIRTPSARNGTRLKLETLIFLVVEEEPLLDRVRASILATLAAIILIIGVFVQARIQIILTNQGPTL